MSIDGWLPIEADETDFDSRRTWIIDRFGLSVICVQKVPLRKVSKINEIAPRTQGPPGNWGCERQSGSFASVL
jgi:hypothetical protein